jgi:hypothetical protein
MDIIHKSFTKKDLIDFIQTYDIPISDPKQYNKNDLCEAFTETLNDFEIEWNTDFPEFHTNDDLLKYLYESKSNEVLNYREKTEMIQKAKKLINYARNGYMISFTDYMSIDEIYQDGILVANHCDIPTCRRAIQELNNDPKIRNKIEMKLSPKMKKILDQKKINKNELKPRLKFERKYIELSFD